MIALSQDGLMSDTDIRVFDVGNKPRNFETFPMRDSNDPNRRGLAMFFLPPLPPGEHFTIQITEKAKLQGADFNDFVYRTNRLGNYAIEKIDLVLHVPKDSKIALSKHDESPAGEQYDANPTKSLKILGFDAIGWRGQRIKLAEKQPFGVFINKK